MATAAFLARATGALSHGRSTASYPRSGCALRYICTTRGVCRPFIAEDTRLTTAGGSLSVARGLRPRFSPPRDTFLARRCSYIKSAMCPRTSAEFFAPHVPAIWIARSRLTSDSPLLLDARLYARPRSEHISSRSSFPTGTYIFLFLRPTVARYRG